MADDVGNSRLNTSIEELVNGVLRHPNFRNAVDSINSGQTNNQSGIQGNSVNPETSVAATGPAQELRNLFQRGTSMRQQQNLNATIPRFNNRFSYQSRGRNRSSPYIRCNQGQGSKPKGKATSSATVSHPFYREVVLLNSPTDVKVVRGAKKVYLHKTGNVKSAFQFDKQWSSTKVYDELLKEFPQLEGVTKDPKFQILMGVGNDLVKPQLTSGQELTGEYLNKIFTQRTVWLVPSEKTHYHNPFSGQAVVLADSDEDDAENRDDNDGSGDDDELPPTPWSDVNEMPSDPPEQVDDLQKIFPQKERMYLQEKLDESNGSIEQAVIAILNEQCDQPELKNSNQTSDQESHQRQSPNDAFNHFRRNATARTPLRQLILVKRSPESIIKDVLKLFKRGAIDIRQKPDVEFIGEAGMDADALTREFCHIVMSALKNGSGGLVFFEGEEDHLLPVHCAEYTASQYFVYVGKMIAHSVLHSGKGFVGLSPAISEFLVTNDLESSMLQLTISDVPDLEVRATLVKIQDARSNDDLCLTSNELLILTEAGFVNEIINTQNKYRACQCVMTHVVFNARKEEIDQLRRGMESISLISFLKSNGECLPSIFPLAANVKISVDDFLRIIPQCTSGMEDDEKIINWFAQYVKDVGERKKSEKEGILSALPSMEQMTQFLVGHPYLPSTMQLRISFAEIPLPDPDACFMSVKLPSIYSSYGDFKHAMNVAITSQYAGFGRG